MQVVIHIYYTVNFPYMKFGITNSNKFSFGLWSSFQVFEHYYWLLLPFKLDLLFGKILNMWDESH